MGKDSTVCGMREAMLSTTFSKRKSEKVYEQKNEFGNNFQERRRKTEGHPVVQQKNINQRQSNQHSLIPQHHLKQEQEKMALMIEPIKIPDILVGNQASQDQDQQYWIERINSKRDLSQLIFDQELLEFIRFSIENVQIFYDSRKQILLSYKAQIDNVKNFCSLSEMLKPFMKIKEQIEALFPQEQSIEIKQLSENNIMFQKQIQLRLEELQIEDNHQVINQEAYLSNNISKQHPLFSEKWQAIHDNVDQFINEQKRKEQNTFEKADFQECHEYKSKCLFCQPLFFYYQKIFDQTVTKEKIVLAGPIKQIQKNRQFLKEEITGLMNNKGGIILFDIVKQSFSFRAKGDVITNYEVFQIQKIVKQLLRQITPIPKIQEQITLTFVPVAQRSKEKNSKDHFASNLFVTRITVKPSSYFECYTFMKEGSEIMAVRNKSIFNSPEYKHHLSGQALHEEMLKRQKMKEQFEKIPEDLQFYFSTSKQNDHQCEKPFRGTQDCINQQMQRTPEKYFKQAVIVVINRKFKLLLQKKLESKGISCLVKFPFQHLNIKGAQVCSIIYLNLEYRYLLEKTSMDREFVINGRPFLAAQITNYIKLDQPIQLKNLYTWVREECGTAIVELIEYRNEIQKEFYIHCQHKTALALIYLLFVHFRGKASFKEPNKGEGFEEDKIKVIERCP